MVDAKKIFDYVVIGAGSGGIASARRAAQHGKKVAIIENRRIGGTCVNVGCVPKKVMFNLATFLEDTELFKHYGVSYGGDVKLDFAKFKQARDAYVTRLNGIYKKNLEGSQVEYFEGEASFESAKVVKVGDKLLEGEHILIASGSHPDKPAFEGGELCLSSDDIFELKELPKSMIVIGGGYIGIEMAQIMQTLGTKTTWIVRSKPLRFADDEVVEVLVKNIDKLGLGHRIGTQFKKVTQGDNGLFQLHMEDGEVLEAEKILSAIGRPPNFDHLNLEAAGVIHDGKKVIVDDFSNTNVAGIYALGDVIDKVNLTPAAVRCGRILSERLFNGKTTLRMNYDNIATIVFSHPPIGTVGLSQEDAEKQFGKDKVKSYKSEFINMLYSPSTDDKLKLGSLFKVICHFEPDGTERVVGAHGIGRGIDEMMQGISIAISMGATKQDFDNSVAIHPTASEEWVLMETKYV